MSRVPSCGYCHGAAKFTVTRDTPGSPEIPACKPHLSLAIEKAAQQAGAASVTVYLLESRAAVLAGGGLDAGDILERVRRIGAHSAGDPRVAHSMEDALYLAVLVMIAHGSQGPSGLASAALMSRRYDFERLCG